MMERLTTSNAILDKIYGYPEDVIAGKIIACKKTITACERFLRELDRSRHDPTYRWRFDERQAARPIEFMERFLSPTKGDYDHMELMPWQCFVEGNLYGWLDKDTGLRRFREGLVVVGRGNGKSTLMAGNSTYGASKDGERGADVYLLANSKEQAGIVYEECQKQIKASPALAQRFRVLRDGIHYDKTNSTIKHRASDSKRLDGLNPHIGIFDEIHEYHDFKLINVIKRGMNKRRQPLALYITTMGTVLDGPLTYYYALFTDAMTEGLLPESVADRMFCYICELDEMDSVDDISVWPKANPSAGVLLSIDQLKDDWDRCKSIPPERSDFINKQLNITTDTSDATFVSADVIKRNEAVVPIDSLAGRLCYGGFDLSSREDFTSAALEFPLDDGRIFVLSHTWVPERKVALDNEKIQYHEWAMLGLLTICPGEYVPQDVVFEWFKARAKEYEIMTIGYDPANAIWLVRALEAQGFNCQIVRQGPITLNDPMKDVRELLLDGRVVTNKDPLMRWYMNNVRLRNDYRDREKENWMPVKRNRYRKIDGFMAWLDSHTVAMQNEPLGNVDTEANITIYDI
ncbi:terminase large subunit [Eubacteriales bacterium OttesenSCG-928-A19]|nr:terminase large subunit [Eubacteriales bacterium OttesenSCG-928-A19]